MNRIALHWQILIAILLAIVLGTQFPQVSPYVSWMGTLFIRALKMIVVPLVISSLIIGVSNMGGTGLGRIGLKTLSYYLATSLLAILTGLFLVNTIKPGAGASMLIDAQDSVSIQKKSIIDTLLEIIPDNVFQSIVNGDMLPIIFFTLLFGIFINKVDNRHSQFLKDLFQSVFEVMMQVTLFVLRFAPLGVLGLITKTVAEIPDLHELAVRLGKYMLVVVAGLGIHFFITLPLILRFVAGIHPLKHIKAMSTPLLTALSTASSNGTLPVTIEATEQNAGVSNKIASFTLPLGATINMDGTALYELVVAGFIAQVYGIELSVGEQFIMVTTALLASIGTAAVPMASLVTMTIIFEAIGLPFEGIALILPIDRPLDHLRTTTNVFSDTCAAVTIAKSEGETLNI